MFFPERVQSVLPEDRVLEIGPGASPHPASQVFLEKRFVESEAFKQRGRLPGIELKRPVVYYDGGKFPFRDKEFDYVICSHVLEHVDEVGFFVQELNRVARRGYIEFPNIRYEYLYSIAEHLNLLWYENGEILWMPKNETRLVDFASIQQFLRSTLTAGHHEMIQSLKECFIEGFEWTASIRVRYVSDLRLLAPPVPELVPHQQFGAPATGVQLVSELFRRLGRRIKELTNK